ncbi:MAG TPA: EAL domain-containing protein [Hyphomicrobium sp.]|nr:EAL domain-containing protein [Hyphomicrobium sp.]
MLGTYSLALVGLSFVVAVAASYVAFALAAHISSTKGWAGAYWLAGGAVAMGAGIWSMHFVGMLAYELPIPMSYNFARTLVSLVIAILVSGFGLHLVARTVPSTANLAAGAIIMGVGIASMHYMGMDAMNVAPPPTYNGWLVAASLAVAIAASALALSLAFRLRNDASASIMWKRLLAALAMGAGICAMHYTAMAAAAFAPGTICTSPTMEIDQFWLAVLVAGMTLLFLGATMLILTIDVRLAYQLDEANARIAALAREDPLTGLANRRTFMEALEAAFQSRARDKIDFAVLFLDLDGFKDVNDGLGHAAGDALIVKIANRLRSNVRQDDIVARFGGDEFAILQRNVRSATDAMTLAEKLSAAISRPVRIGHEDVSVTSSIGIAQATDARTTPADLMVQVDLALYRAKDDGRNCSRFHNSDLDSQMRTRMLLARELQTAIERGEMELLYQPQVQIATGRIIGLKAHLQWNHPSRGIIRPSVFLPIAERTGTIPAIAAWMMDEACRQMQQWRAHDVAPAVLSVSIYNGQLKTGTELFSELAVFLERYGIPASSIELVFDEAVLMRATERFPSTLEALRERGFRMAINDFGMGYSSIGYIAGAPVQRLGIPASLVTGALGEGPCARAVRAIVQIARELGAETIADGVETQAQAVFLLAAGCEQAQGTFFGQCLSAMEATLLLRDAAATRTQQVAPDSGRGGRAHVGRLTG